MSAASTREGLPLRFPEEKMDMLRHDHVTDDDKEMARLGRAKKGPPPVATGGDEVKVSRAMVAVKIPWHPDGVT